MQNDVHEGNNMRNVIDLLGIGKFYKASLHTHTNISDGSYSPEEVKKGYMEQGYSIVAYTDHEVLVSHQELSDENFLALTAYELSINENTVERLHPYEKCYHFNCYSSKPELEISPVFSIKEVWLEKSKKYISEEQLKIDFDLKYNNETVTKMIKKLNESGFLVCYNHPSWSMSGYEDYSFIDGLWGIEVFNGGGGYGGNVESITPFEYLLMQKKNVYPIAADDMHYWNEAFLGFTMIKSPSLTYEDVFEALKKGNFYSSEGPIITSLMLEGKTLHIECSECRSVIVSTPIRKKVNVRGEKITKCEIDLSYFFDNYEAIVNSNIEPYFRVTIVDSQGRNAYTKAYFIKDYI